MDISVLVWDGRLDESLSTYLLCQHRRVEAFAMHYTLITMQRTAFFEVVYAWYSSEAREAVYSFKDKEGRKKILGV